MGNLKGKDLICTQEWAKEDLDKLFKLAFEMKQDRFGKKYLDLLYRKQFFMFFFNLFPSGYIDLILNKMEIPAKRNSSGCWWQSGKHCLEECCYLKHFSSRRLISLPILSASFAGTLLEVKIAGHSKTAS